MRVVFIGDVVGKAGRAAVRGRLRSLIERYKIDFAIANGENAAGGFGITQSVSEELFASGIDVITTGNHIWDKKEAMPYLAKESRVLRPLNYPPGVPGAGSITATARNGNKIAVVNASGRVFMSALDCPFRTSKEEFERLRKTTNIIVVDFHAEATSEKQAYGYYFDGAVSAVIGTHTHVQTADERILPGGTAYITDVGMNGPSDSVMGVEKAQILERFLLQMPVKFEVAKGPSVLMAVIVDIDPSTGRAASIERIQLRD